MKNVIIFGDSYSTHKDAIPAGYSYYYCDEGREDKLEVTKMRMEDTWWYKFMARIGGNLVRNDSWSGSTISYTGYDNKDCSRSSSFIYRYRKLKAEGFFEKNEVDTVLVFGGTNDSWTEAPIGEIKTSGWEERDLYKAIPAIFYLAHTLKEDLPSAEIVLIINSDIKEGVQDAIEEAARCNGLKSVRLVGIDKVDGHPTVKGMQEICDQLIKAWRGQKMRQFLHGGNS